ncbi:glyoxylase-like metal-dependent hydrolase (beta-lactamase superfamily II) [Alkalispirillum mobile]|uniref:Glyoxylase-like metal-dependent hydrolase (Beta-lactamase superfamily II) n=1 Tax=Alkalispirillum mobile TaxID=85925 RepID=A0A498BVF1_9GAMM|nr:MBL fold metallo-hydrolase [Alkalispirillum mobile]RLK46849.1 glyoxylase-like metal-dependent hydrolase (beta-lactamase superfamily II) [Alkalispirillum mobile]
MKLYVIPVASYQENCVVVACERTQRAAVVDPGGSGSDVDKVLAEVDDLGLTVESILVTHGHIDHVAGVKEMSDRLQVPVIGPHEDDRPVLAQLDKQAKLFGYPPAPGFEPDRWVEDGESIDVGDVRLQVVLVPGHTPGHVAFFDPESRYALTGDLLFQGAIGRSDFPGGDHDTLVRSIREKLFPLGDDVTFVPGHGPASTFGEERRTNPFVGDAAVA